MAMKIVSMTEDPIKQLILKRRSRRYAVLYSSQEQIKRRVNHERIFHFIPAGFLSPLTADSAVWGEGY
jgi:hypothetical protein